MIIHLEVNWPTAALEQFVLIVCQHSLHFALQLHFILVGAMEDYALETPQGRSTAHGHPRYYRRCAKLLQVGRHGASVPIPELHFRGTSLTLVAPAPAFFPRTCTGVWFTGRLACSR